MHTLSPHVLLSFYSPPYPGLPPNQTMQINILIATPVYRNAPGPNNDKTSGAVSLSHTHTPRHEGADWRIEVP